MRFVVPVVALGACLTIACGDRKSSAGFRLPDGDPARGRVVFAEMKCHACHSVSGMANALPAPVSEPVLLLGGEVPYAKTDGELVTSIIHPSHHIASAYATSLQTKGGERNRMPDFSEAMSVRQMIDLVAFLQSRYEVVRPGTPPGD